MFFVTNISSILNILHCTFTPKLFCKTGHSHLPAWWLGVMDPSFIVSFGLHHPLPQETHIKSKVSPFFFYEIKNTSGKGGGGGIRVLPKPSECKLVPCSKDILILTYHLGNKWETFQLDSDVFVYQVNKRSVVLATSMSAWPKLESFGKWECQLSKCTHKTALSVSMWDMFLIIDYCARA